MDITKYEQELQQMCSRELGNILQTYYNQEDVRAKLGGLLDYGATLIETLQEMNIDLTAEQYRTMLIAEVNLIDDLNNKGIEIVGSASSDRCRDDIESYLVDNGLMGR